MSSFCLDRDPRALLMFSGGETRREAGPKSEAQSYWAVADAADWYGGCQYYAASTAVILVASFSLFRIPSVLLLVGRM